MYKKIQKLLAQFDAGKLTYLQLCEEFIALANANPEHRGEIMSVLNTCDDEPEMETIYRKNLR